MVYWRGDETLAAALAELADRSGPWPGIVDAADGPIRIVLAPNHGVFDSLTRRQLPEWGAAAAFPGRNIVVINRSAGNLVRVLRHELAHLALHERVRHVPRWFDEGYASWAAGEWDRVEALKVNWALLRGAVPSLDQLDRYLVQEGPARAEAAYALSTTAVLLLNRLGGERGLEPLLSELEHTVDFDRALRRSFRITLGQFEERWWRDLKRRYGWVLFFTSFALFWSVVGAALAVLWVWRRRRDRRRREALDEGWVLPE